MGVNKNDLQESLQDSLTRHNVPGASIAVLQGGELITAAAGVTNVTTGVELTADTVMHIGSITKVFNATLVMQMVDEGIVDLDARVLRYLPDLRLKDRDALEQITVKMLLNHTSGIDADGLPDYGHDEETIEKAIARIAELEQLHRPGTEFSYCNGATVIAGYLAQRLRGQSWYRLIRERIFEPLRLEHAATLPEEALLHRASVGHYLTSNQQPSRASFAFLPLGFSPAGVALMISARDLLAFAKAHMAQGVGANGVQILSARSAKAMQQVTVNNKGKGYTYDFDSGIGWMLSDRGLLSHAGGGRGISSVLYAHPEREWAAAILTNAQHGLNLINEFVEPWLRELGITRSLGWGMADIRLPSETVSIDAKRYIGVYGDSLVRYRVSQTADGLVLSRQARFAFYETTSTEETLPSRLIALGGDEFLWELDGDNPGASDASRRFAFRNVDAEGRMRHLGYWLRLYPRIS